MAVTNNDRGNKEITRWLSNREITLEASFTTRLRELALAYVKSERREAK